jgi:hypothetical protein
MAKLNNLEDYDKNNEPPKIKKIGAKKNEKSTSKYFGVNYSNSSKKWVSRINTDGKRTFLGNFKTEIEAAIAYNKMATILYGDRAKLNIIEEA